MAKNRKKDIVLGDKDIGEKDLDLNQAKIRVNTYIDGDIVLELKRQAKEKNTKYQTLLNSYLREAVLNEEDKFKELIKRIEKLEKRVG